MEGCRVGKIHHAILQERRKMTAKELQKRNAKAENLRVLQTEDGQCFVESEKGKILCSVIFASFGLKERINESVDDR